MATKTLKIDRTMYAFAERCGIRIEVAQPSNPHFNFYREDLDLFVGRAHSTAAACAWFRGWLAANGTVDASDPREASA